MHRRVMKKPSRKNQNKTRREKIKRGRRSAKAGVIADPGCNGIGECCKDIVVYLDPFDVWRIFNNTAVRDKYNIGTSRDLYGKSGPLEYWIHPDSGQLRCNIKATAKGEPCRLHESGQCLLCKDRPTDCLARPLLQQRFGLVLDAELCAVCATCDKKIPIPSVLSISSFLAQRDVIPFRTTERGLFSMFEKKLYDLAITKDGSSDLHMLSTALVMTFDFDHLFIKGKVPPSEMVKVRPRNASELIAGVYVVMERIAHSAVANEEAGDVNKGLSGQPKERKTQAGGGVGGGGEEKMPGA